MLWYEMNGKDSDVVVSSRVRLARNLADYPFSPRLVEPAAKEIIERVRGVFAASEDYKFTDFSALDSKTRTAEAERHKVSREFAASKGPSALIESDKKQVYIMLLEEDHIRIQSIMAGFSLEEAYSAALESDRMIDCALRVAFDEKLGYLTHCPTNLGTGMRASVMMFLPALTYTGVIRTLQNQLGKIGLAIRGMEGEGSEAGGCLYQISNQVTLGLSEEEIISKITNICEKIEEQERSLREKMRRDPTGKFTDRIMRAYGTMLYATMVDSAELLKLYADVRLGAAMGIIPDVKVRVLDEMLVRGMPASLMTENADVTTPHQRDTARADMIRKVLSTN